VVHFRWETAKIGPKRDRIVSTNDAKEERARYSGIAGKETRKMKRS
jgi:hypothetical protein